MKASFFVENRRRLSQKLGAGLVVVSAYHDMQRGNDMAHPFEQEANFWYLSGIESSRWTLVYDGQRDHTWLVRPHISEVERIFDGSLTDETALKNSGADEVVDEADFEPLLRQLTRHHTIAHTIKPPKETASFVLNPAQKLLTKRLERIFANVDDCSQTLARLRGIKQPEEIRAIEAAIKITTAAFEAAKSDVVTCKHEYELQAVFDYEFSRRGARHAYDPIVAGGVRACTLHYTANDAALRRPSLVLCDIGARYGGYVADITRTFAVGELTKRQAAVHQAVEQAQQQIIALLKPGLEIKTYQQEVDEIMLRALQQLGLGDDIRVYMPHAVSHGLGIDVHDRLGGVRSFEPGMVVTVEPGIYIPAQRIGVRIEDDILITERGARNLSAALSTAS